MVTSATAEEVDGWMRELRPSDVAIGFQFGHPPVVAPVASPFQVVSAWWD